MVVARGMNLHAWRWKLGKSQRTLGLSFCCPFHWVKALPVFTFSSLTHKQIKVSSILAHFDWKHWTDASSHFFTCKRLDIPTDILSLLHGWLQSPSTLRVFPPLLSFLSLHLHCLNTCWREKEALKRNILTVGAGRGCCPWLRAVLD